MLTKIFLIIFVLAITYNLPPTTAHAIELNSPRFKLEMENIDIDTQENQEPVVYTIKSLYGSRATQEFNSYGYTLNQTGSDSPISFSLSNSLITFDNMGKNHKQDQVAEFSAKEAKINEFNISFIQEYPLKNYSGDMINLYYSLGEEDSFRKPPNQNSGDQPTIISTNNVNNLSKIIFRINTPNRPLEGTYDTIINFILASEN